MSKSLFTEPASSLRSDGSRNYVHPADVRGRFTRLRNITFSLLLAIYILLPWISIGGHPALFLDIAARRFYIFGLSFNAQDAWLLFFLLSGIGFALFVVTALLGRIWCGYACPQTVFLEGVFRKIERLVEGPREQRLRRNKGPWSKDKIVRKVIKHSLYLALALLLANVFVSYFVSLPELLEMMRSSPLDHLGAFTWMAVISAIIYGNFAWFREQLCLIICPYGRLQSVMTDKDTMVIGYDEKRGEPRGKRSDPNAGDCVDCGRCTAVCPTGIDIRHGLQVDCIGCAACVDACDEIMVKLNRPVGLVRYDSLRGLHEGKRKIWRPRLALYAVLGCIGLAVAFVGIGSHTGIEATLLRMGRAPYNVDPKGDIENSLELHVTNKGNETLNFRLEPVEGELRYVIAPMEFTLRGGQGRRIPVFVYGDADPKADEPVQIHVHAEGEDSRLVEVDFLRPH